MRPFITIAVLFALLQSTSLRAEDLFQDPLNIGECDWELMGTAVNPASYELYSLEAIEEFQGRAIGQGDGIVQAENDTTADRLENKSWATLKEIDSVLDELRQTFPSFQLRDGGASNVRSDYYRTFHAAIWVDEKTGYLVSSDKDLKVLQAHPERYSERMTAIKLRARKYDGSDLTKSHTKLELKFRSPIAGKIDKPSVLFEDADVAKLLGPAAPDEPTVRQIAARTKAIVDSQGRIANRKPEQVESILTIVSLMRTLHQQANVPFTPIIHIGYLRHAYAIPSVGVAGDRYEIQYTRDSDLFTMSPQIVPKIINPELKPSRDVIARSPRDVAVLEDKTPLAKTGIDPISKKMDPARQRKIEESHPDIKKQHEILSRLEKPADLTPYQVNRGKRYHFGHGILKEPPAVEHQAQVAFDDPTE